MYVQLFLFCGLLIFLFNVLEQMSLCKIGKVECYIQPHVQTIPTFCITKYVAWLMVCTLGGVDFLSKRLCLHLCIYSNWADTLWQTFEESGKQKYIHGLMISIYFSNHIVLIKPFLSTRRTHIHIIVY